MTTLSCPSIISSRYSSAEMAAAGNQKKPEYTLEDWTISSSAVQVPQRPPKTRLSDAEVLQWAQGPVGASTGSQSGWRIEILIADFDRPNLEPLAQLVVALGGRREDAIAPFRPLGTFTEPFPSFQAHRSARTDPQLVDVSRHFCLLDGIDNTYWVSFPRDRCTKVVACARSPKDFWTERFHELVHTTLQKDLCHPVAAGVAVLIADVEPFNGGVRACIDGLRALHLETGLHQLSGITTEAHDPNILGEMTKDVCGYTMNLHTYTLGLRRLHRFADFLLQECDIAESAAGQSPDGTDTVVRDIHVEILRSHTSLRPFLEAWKRRAHGLLEEAESWENRASILVQTVFTLSTQRDTVRVAKRVEHVEMSIAVQDVSDPTVF